MSAKDPLHGDSVIVPSRLIEGNNFTAETLRRAIRDTERDIDEERAWNQFATLLTPNARRPSTARFWVKVTMATALAAAAVALVNPKLFDRPGGSLEPPIVHAPAKPILGPAVSPLPSRLPLPSRHPLPSRRALALTATTTPLPTGEVDLEGEALAVLSRDGVADAVRAGDDTIVNLGRGKLALQVAPRRKGQTFQVNVPPYRFTVIGTSFTINMDGGRVHLAVSEGIVAVSTRQKRIAAVEAGGRWDGLLGSRHSSVERGETPPGSSSAPPPADEQAQAQAASPGGVTTAAPDPCRDLTRAGRAREAVDCFLAKASGAGLAAETALFEVGRLRRDELGDATGALAAFRDYQRRFTGGALKPEADLSVVELLIKLGRFREALDESGRCLASRPTPDRAIELHLLRGNIHREALGDCAGALPEYEAAKTGRGPKPDEAAFKHAVCLETLGRLSEAEDAYEDYLERPTPLHEAEATHRLDALSR